MVIPHFGPLHNLPRLTFTPPGPARALLVRPQHEALGLNHVEEEFAHQIGGPGVGQLETGAESEEQTKQRNWKGLRKIDVGVERVNEDSDLGISSYLFCIILCQYITYYELIQFGKICINIIFNNHSTWDDSC